MIEGINLLISIIGWLFNIYYILIIVYILMSWIPQIADSPVGNVIGKVVEPYLSVFRRIIPPIGMIDFSPIVALIALRFVEQGLLALISWIIIGVS